jgi:hypothetical protein
MLNAMWVSPALSIPPVAAPHLRQFPDLLVRVFPGGQRAAIRRCWTQETNMDIMLIVVAHLAIAALVLVVLSTTIAYVRPDVRPDGLQR